MGSLCKEKAAKETGTRDPRHKVFEGLSDEERKNPPYLKRDIEAGKEHVAENKKLIDENNFLRSNSEMKLERGIYDL